MKRSLVLMSMLLLIQVGSVFAKPVSTLFQAEVMVKNRSQAEWRQGVKKALAEVFIKVSGNEAVNTLPPIKQLKPSLTNIVQSYSYQRKSLYQAMDQWFLNVRFDAQQIKTLLQDADQLVWDGARPRTILWLTLPTDSGRSEILSADLHPQYVSLIQGRADQRGIPMIVPAMDLNDIASISVKDVKSNNIALVNEAGRRYGADSYLIANLRFGEDQYWHAECIWGQSGAQVRWELNDNALPNLLTQIVDQMTNRVVSQYSTLLSADNTQTVQVRVLGVQGVDDCNKVVTYLKALQFIKDVEIDTLESKAVVLSITYGGTQSQLEMAIENATGKRLVYIDADAVIDDSQAAYPLVYRWLEPIAQGAYQGAELQ